MAKVSHSQSLKHGPCVTTTSNRHIRCVPCHVTYKQLQLQGLSLMVQDGRSRCTDHVCCQPASGSPLQQQGTVCRHCMGKPVVPKRLMPAIPGLMNQACSLHGQLIDILNAHRTSVVVKQRRCLTCHAQYSTILQCNELQFHTTEVVHSIASFCLTMLKWYTPKLATL